MPSSASASTLPRETLSRLAALLALSLLLARFVELPWAWEGTLALPGLTLTFTLGTGQILAFFIAWICLSGALTLFQQHPISQRHAHAWYHRLPQAVFPTLIAWGLQVLLYRLPLSPIWWGGLALGLVAFIALLSTEYYALDPDAPHYATAATVLSGLGFLALLLLSYSLHLAGWRLIYLIPTLGGAVLLVALRTLHLRAPDRWRPVEAVLIATTVLHPAAVARYLPLSALSYALLVTALAYATTVFAGNLLSGESPREAATEPLVSLGLFGLIWLWSLR